MVSPSSAPSVSGGGSARGRNLALKPTRLSVESWGLVLLLLSAALFSGMGCFVHLAASTGLPSTELAFLRTIFQGAFVLAAMVRCRAATVAQGCAAASAGAGGEGGGKCEALATAVPGPRLLQRPFGGTPQVRGIVLLRGAVGGFGFVNFYYTMSALPIGDATTLLSLYPVLAILMGWTCMGETVHFTHIVAANASILGAVLIARPSLVFGGGDDLMNSGRPPTMGYVTAMLGSCCAAAVIVLIRKAGTIGAHTLQLLFSWATFGIAFSVLLGYVECLLGGGGAGCGGRTGTDVEWSTWRWRVPPTAESWLYVAGVCVLGSVAHFLLNYAGRLAPAGLGSVARSSDIAWGYLWQVVVFWERPTPLTLLGVTLILASLVMIAVQRWREEGGKKEREMEGDVESGEKTYLLHDRRGGASTSSSEPRQCQIAKPSFP